MKIINKEVIKSLKPCVDRYENYLVHYSEFIGTIEEFLFLPEISHRDKLWVGLRLLPRNLVEVFAIDCAVSAQNYYAANAANAAGAAAYAANAAADNAADNAAANAATAAAAYVANAAADNAADNAAAYAATADNAAAYAATADAAEKEFQIEALIWLFNSEKQNEN